MTEMHVPVTRRKAIGLRRSVVVGGVVVVGLVMALLWPRGLTPEERMFVGRWKMVERSSSPLIQYAVFRPDNIVVTETPGRPSGEHRWSISEGRLEIHDIPKKSIGIWAQMQTAVERIFTAPPSPLVFHWKSDDDRGLILTEVSTSTSPDEREIVLAPIDEPPTHTGGSSCPQRMVQ